MSDRICAHTSIDCSQRCHYLLPTASPPKSKWVIVWQLLLHLGVGGETAKIIHIQDDDTEVLSINSNEHTLITSKLSALHRTVFDDPVLEIMKPIPSSLHHPIDIFLEVHALLNSIGIILFKALWESAIHVLLF